jgi:hypothetical protein
MDLSELLLKYERVAPWNKLTPLYKVKKKGKVLPVPN